MLRLILIAMVALQPAFPIVRELRFPFRSFGHDPVIGFPDAVQYMAKVQGVQQPSTAGTEYRFILSQNLETQWLVLDTFYPDEFDPTEPIRVPLEIAERIDCVTMSHESGTAHEFRVVLQVKRRDRWTIYAIGTFTISHP